MLTDKQIKLLRVVHDRIAMTGIPPSFDEMRSALGLRSKSGIFRLLNALEERGFIRRFKNRARAIEILRLPEGFHAHRLASKADRARQRSTDLLAFVQRIAGMQQQDHPIVSEAKRLVTEVIGAE